VWNNTRPSATIDGPREEQIGWICCGQPSVCGSTPSFAVSDGATALGNPAMPAPSLREKAAIIVGSSARCCSFATTVIYVDRQVLGILAPGLKKEFGWTNTNYSFIVNFLRLGLRHRLFLGSGGSWTGSASGRVFVAVFSIWSVTSLANGLIGPLV